MEVTPQDFFGDLLDAGQDMTAQFAAGIITFFTVCCVFLIIIGAFLYFTTYSMKRGRALLLNGILLMVVMYTLWGTLGFPGAPNIMAWFGG